jgi:hypothetical protein
MELTSSNLALWASLLAGLVGTATMTISSGTEAAWTQRGDSPVPGIALLWPFKKLFGLTVEGRALYTIAVPAHYIIGVFWGGAWWLLIDVAELGLFATTLIFAAAVWLAAILILKITGIAPWPWTWGIKYNIYDWMHHSAYVGGVLGTWVLVEQVAQSVN